MRTLVYILILCAAASLRASAQASLVDSIASELVDNPWLYPSFAQGKIVFRDGTVAKAPMNYNMEFGDVEFISSKKDTMAVNDETDIWYIAVNTDTFFYDKQYLQLLGSNAQVKLAKHTIVKLTDTKRTGAFGTTTESPGVTYYSTISRNAETIHLQDPRGQVFKKVTTYYVGDEYNHFMQLTKKNLLKKYSKDKEAVSAYLDNNHTDFSRETDLKKLGTYLQTIGKP